MTVLSHCAGFDVIIHTMLSPACSCAGESLGKLVRTAEKAKIPVMCIVGNKEAETDTLAVRTYGGGQQSDIQSEEVLSRLLRAVSTHGKF